MLKNANTELGEQVITLVMEWKKDPQNKHDNFQKICDLIENAEPEVVQRTRIVGKPILHYFCTLEPPSGITAGNLTDKVCPIIEALLQKNVDINALENEETALFHALYNRDTRVRNLLDKHGADVDIGKSILAWAIPRDDIGTVKFFLERTKKHNINFLDIILSFFNGQFQMAFLLMKHKLVPKKEPVRPPSSNETLQSTNISPNNQRSPKNNP